MTTPMLRQIDPPPAEDVSRYCGKCGYDLRGSAEPRCPECGEAFDPAETPLADVPWFHRRSVGTGVALWRTMWLVMLQPRRFAHAVRADARLDVPAARRFRRICVVVAAASAALSVALHMRTPEALAWIFAVALLPFLVFFGVTAVVVAVADFDSGVRAARFQTLHEFANAPLLLMPLVPLAVAFCRATRLARTPQAPLLVLAVVMSIWIVSKFAYQVWAYGRGLTWLAVHLTLAVVVWTVFALFCFALLAGGVAFTSRLFDW